MATKAKNGTPQANASKAQVDSVIRGLYINKEMAERFRRLQGKTINIDRLDPEGTPYVEEYAVPDKIITMARDALYEFFGTLERAAGIDRE